MSTKDTEKPEEKKPGQGGEEKVKETILEQTESADTSDAETTIRAFLRDRLYDFHEEVETALDLFEAHIMSQPEEFKPAFNQMGFFGFMADVFQKQLLEAGGGAGKPIMTSLVGEVANASSFAETTCGTDLSLFINNAFRRGVRDATWYVRDSAPFLLGESWGELLKLAADGGNQFIPALYHMGLPSYAFKPQQFAEELKLQADGYRRAMGLQIKEVEEKQPVEDEAKKHEIDEQSQKDMMMQQEKKEITAAAAG
jgi:hypothetical protein